MAKITKTMQLGEQTLVLETGEIARQADGAVFASMDGTQVLVTVVGKKDGAEKNSFFPLTVIYQEKAYAAGKNPGGFNKREGRPSEHETLVSRLIDRPLRPLFPDNFHNEIQIIATVMSFNPEVSADIVAMIGASAALAISGIPFEGPIGGVRVGYKDGIYLLNPGKKEQSTSTLDLVVAGTSDAILMVESEARELSEDVMLGAVLFGHETIKDIIKTIKELAADVKKPKWNWTTPSTDTILEQRINELATADITSAYLLKDKQQRYQRLDECRQKILDSLSAEYTDLNRDTAANLLSAL